MPSLSLYYFRLPGYDALCPYKLGNIDSYYPFSQGQVRLFLNKGVRFTELAYPRKTGVLRFYENELPIKDRFPLPRE